MKKIQVIEPEKLKDMTPMHTKINGLDMVIIRYDEKVSVLYCRRQHQGTLMADGHIDGPPPSLGIDRNALPKWEQIQFLSAQLAV